MALFGVEQDHARTISPPGNLVRALNTPDQASGEWDWSYSYYTAVGVKRFGFRSGVVADHSLPD